MSAIIVIPCYEPRENVLTFIKELREQTETRILLIDDGSGKKYHRIFQILEQLSAVTVLSYSENKGKGYALKRGFQELLLEKAEVDVIVTADSDGQHAIEDIKRLTEQVKKVGKDTLVLGTRSFEKATTPFKSYWGNKISSLLFQLISGIKCEDTQTGLRGFHSALLSELLAVEGERFDYEMNVLLRSKEAGIKLEQLSIQTIYEENNNHSHFRAIQDSYLIYKPIFRYFSTALLSSGVDVFMFAVLMMGLGNSTASVLPATIMARMLSGIVNFLLVRSWVFQDQRRIQVTLGKYILLFLGQMALSALGVRLLLKLVPLALLSKLIVDGTLFVGGFVIQNRLIFQKEKVME